MHRLDRDVLVPLIGKLIERRRGLGITQFELNARIGCADGHLAKWEAGMHRPSIHFLLLWCETLGLRLDLGNAS